MTKISVVREYRDRYPDFPNLKLARIIYAENKELFSSVEAIRTAIRTIQGQAGKTNSGIIKPIVKVQDLTIHTNFLSQMSQPLSLI